MNKLTLLFVTLSTAAILGCDPQPKTPPAATATPASADAAHGFKANCVICGDHEIDVLPDTARTDHDGKTYYFCAIDCKDEFLKNPTEYVKATPTTAPTTQSAL